jgi:hypothetical protein
MFGVGEMGYGIVPSCVSEQRVFDEDRKVVTHQLLKHKKESK